ncbi:helix-turn-helix domain-containing protein [Pseudoalteromonas shioyasakiensis]|uniref:helix-turn-helix transcriptional regulator n=1 Tax=Pseudoalteromonas TaxID=53246 RepID=UPI000C971ED6|nr:MULTISPECIES: helix-turn-helix transcriptional regulator [Pseudoalteromonas]MAD04956.1 transcriptional regulator [Pseudoalteromonas sp.]MCG9707313.1 helix-turn-helix domain-containing protein [Pseudoalteromonas sp. Isolate3]MCP4586043.1 helix-turn-helix transcriptional regulator [Pseudoalteromonas sp.]MCQ8880971.1 helix-turn-helix domain-containing protein [Pseudoalteromonas shioyasakiensis]NIZ06861.1 helix-turn-helix transcriptional regulator [Pseudoalteromonas sp. HF66]|tara:strand:- start:59289 stop:59606 length:318 start_codon:yes stop_codon:yes gene_type:complete
MQLNPNTIKALRLKFEWTQQQLADACDVSLRTIQRVEKEGAASKETTMSLCAVFEVRQGELIKLDDESTNDSKAHAVSKQNLAVIVATSSFISFALGMATVFVIF